MLAWQDIHSFRFEWPWALALLVLVPLWWYGYARYKRRRIEKTALQFSYTAVAAQLRQSGSVWRRLLVPIAVSALMACLIVGLARPTVTAQVPVESADLMLVMDISLSMLADDIKPQRIEAAKQAAINFIRHLPGDMRVGLEFFAGDNYILTPPTSRHKEVIAYLQALSPQDLKPRTEIGSALHTALQVLQKEKVANANAKGGNPTGPSGSTTSSGTTNGPNASGNADSSNAGNAAGSQSSGQTSGNAAGSSANDTAMAAGKRHDQVIVLLSDGDSHEGYPWDVAAQDALKAQVMIYSIGVGSPEGGTITYQGMELPVSFDETTLRRIAEITGGNYFRVFREGDFKRVYEQIQARTVHYEERDLDLTFIAAGAAFVVLLTALGLAITL